MLATIKRHEIKDADAIQENGAAREEEQDNQSCLIAFCGTHAILTFGIGAHTITPLKQINRCYSRKVI